MLWPCKIKYHACVHFVMLLKSESTSYSLADKCTQSDICVCSVRAFFAYISAKKALTRHTRYLAWCLIWLSDKKYVFMIIRCMGPGVLPKGDVVSLVTGQHCSGMYISLCLLSQGSQYLHISRGKIGSICDKEYLISPLVPHISIYISQGKKEVYMIRNISPPLSATYMGLWIRWALVKIMACRLFGAKPLSEPMLGFWQLEP